jgi:predicted CXXCH cytochrome family protein
VPKGRAWRGPRRALSRGRAGVESPFIEREEQDSISRRVRSESRPTRSPRRGRLVTLAFIIFATGGTVGCRFADSNPKRLSTASGAAAKGPVFVGSKVCSTCHICEFKAWRGSHHRLAMQPATDATVLGDFAGTRFANGDVTTSFFRDGDGFMVRTDGPDGELHDYQIKYTFGVSPLQQYLVEFPGRRLQALGIAWDSRPRAAGGQRWFALYPGVKAPSPLHWTAIDQTWNYMCADCHSTGVKKRYDLATRTYGTTYAEIDVGCEACHGPGSGHVAWAGRSRDQRAYDPRKGLTITLDEGAGISWQTDPLTGEVRRSEPRRDAREVEMCARCHSRRTQIHEDYVHGQPPGDDYRVALLDEDLYFPDGQIKGEVYEYGSFIQSRMFHEGVTCSDCHDPHTAMLRAEGNDLCTRCHLRERYDSAHHHFHSVGTAGARCVECHMPARTYMIVDPRHDHSIRVPRPDLSAILGTPNACNNCHVDKTPQWAANAISKRYGTARTSFQQFGSTLHAGRLGAPGAPSLLSELVSNLKQPAIARASALELLAAFDASNDDLLRASSEDKSGLVRRAAADMFSGSGPEAGAATVLRLLQDPVRAVRIEAAESLAGVDGSALPRKITAALDHASAEYVNAQKLNADRPEAHLNLAIFFDKKGEVEQAKAELRTALSIDPSFSPAAVNLADLDREMGRDDEAEGVLRQAMQHAPGDASLAYALGLVKVREKQRAQALKLFATAVRLDPSNPRYAYVYAIALNEADATKAAIEILERSLKLNPYHRDSLVAVVAFCGRIGDHAKAFRYAKILDQLAAEAPILSK